MEILLRSSGIEISLLEISIPLTKKGLPEFYLSILRTEDRVENKIVLFSLEWSPFRFKYLDLMFLNIWIGTRDRSLFRIYKSRRFLSITVLFKEFNLHL